MRYLPFVVLLTAIYLLLTSNLEWLNIVAGLVIAVGITALLRPEVRAFSWRRLLEAIPAFAQYVFILMYDVIKGGFMVARMALSANLEVNSAIIAIPSNCESELAIALSAHAVSIAPGELVVEIDEGGVMYTHVLDVDQSSEYQMQAQNLRRDLLMKIFR